MSEYQYYEFQAIDKPLLVNAQAALRAMSTRARVTATSFTNSYEWGDLKGDPVDMMARWFDLHLYLANWASLDKIGREQSSSPDRDGKNDAMDRIQQRTTEQQQEREREAGENREKQEREKLEQERDYGMGLGRGM